MTVAILALYLLAVLAIGALSHRFFRGTGEDFFVASRSLGPGLLLVSLFGAHMTSFSVLGASGEAYLRGVGVFALMASSSAVVAPATFLLLGTRVWALGKRHGFLTPIQLFRARWGSDALGTVLLVVLVALLLPYLLIGLIGAGLTLGQLTGGAVPYWAGSLLVCVVVLAYTAYGGMRGTVWVNAFQTSVLLVLGAATLAVVLGRLGGLGAALGRVAAARPDLLAPQPHIGAAELSSYLLVPLSVAMFPHMFLHWLTARRAATFKPSIVGYPLCIVLVWLPTILLGVVASVELPDVPPAQASSVLLRLIELHAPGPLLGLLAAGVLSAVLSSFDSQVLALGTLFTQDVVRHHGFHDRMSERAQLYAGRLFVVAVLVVAFALSLVVPRSIFKLGVWCFSGFAALLPVLVAALWWRRSTWVGALASTLTVAGLWAWLVTRPAEAGGGHGGLVPVAVLLAASTVAMVVGSLATRPPSASALAHFFGDGDGGADETRGGVAGAASAAAAVGATAARGAQAR